MVPVIERDDEKNKNRDIEKDPTMPDARHATSKM
jgi:hypothetical protein